MVNIKSKKSDDGVPIRAVSRAFAILQLLNRKGDATMTEIKDAIGLPYPTVYRMMMTLAHDGFIESDPQKRYRPTELVWSLVAGFQSNDQLVSIAKPMMSEFTAEHLWPVAISVRVGSQMMVKHTTSTMTTQTFTNYYPGYTLPLLECAAGKAYIAFCPADELSVIQKTIGELSEDNAGWGAELAASDFYLAKVREEGFATHARNVHNETPGKTSAISVPVLVDGVVSCTLTMVFFEKAMSIAEAGAQFGAPLTRTAQQIAMALKSS
jgi:IclR family mhp operon transcriptional activator